MEKKTKDLSDNIANCGEAENTERGNLAPEDFELEYGKMICTERNIGNADNKYLEPLAAGAFAIGCVDEVNGAGAREIPEFNATHHELIELARYWKKTALDSEYFVFLTGQIGSRDMRIQPFAYRRISRIADILGEEEIRKVVEDVENEFAKGQDPKAWDVFLNGTSEQADQLREEYYREFEKAHPDKHEEASEEEPDKK